MANRRMMSKDVIQTDSFFDLSHDAQLLYFHLLLCGDDDGFIGNPKSFIRMIGSSDKSLNELVDKEFIITFNSGVMVIRHWSVHNYIQPDRYHETIYQREFNQLVLENNVYYLASECIQDVYKVETEEREGQRQGRVRGIQARHGNSAKFSTFR